MARSLAWFTLALAVCQAGWFLPSNSQQAGQTPAIALCPNLPAARFLYDSDGFTFDNNSSRAQWLRADELSSEALQNETQDPADGGFYIVYDTPSRAPPASAPVNVAAVSPVYTFLSTNSDGCSVSLAFRSYSSLTSRSFVLEHQTLSNSTPAPAVVSTRQLADIDLSPPSDTWQRSENIHLPMTNETFRLRISINVSSNSSVPSPLFAIDDVGFSLLCCLSLLPSFQTFQCPSSNARLYLPFLFAFTTQTADVDTARSLCRITGGSLPPVGLLECVRSYLSVVMATFSSHTPLPVFLSSCSSSSCLTSSNMPVTPATPQHVMCASLDAPTISCENQFFYVPRLVNAPSSVLSPARAVASCGLQSGTLPLVSSRPCIRIYRTRLRSYFNTDIQEGFYRQSSIANSAVVLASGAAAMESNRLPVFCVSSNPCNTVNHNCLADSRCIADNTLSRGFYCLCPDGQRERVPQQCVADEARIGMQHRISTEEGKDVLLECVFHENTTRNSFTWISPAGQLISDSEPRYVKTVQTRGRIYTSQLRFVVTRSLAGYYVCKAINSARVNVQGITVSITSAKSGTTIVAVCLGIIVPFLCVVAPVMITAIRRHRKEKALTTIATMTYNHYQAHDVDQAGTVISSITTCETDDDCRHADHCKQLGQPGDAGLCQSQHDSKQPQHQEQQAGKQKQGAPRAPPLRQPDGMSDTDSVLDSPGVKRSSSFLERIRDNLMLPGGADYEACHSNGLDAALFPGTPVLESFNISMSRKRSSLSSIRSSTQLPTLQANSDLLASAPSAASTPVLSPRNSRQQATPTAGIEIISHKDILGGSDSVDGQKSDTPLKLVFVTALEHRTSSDITMYPEGGVSGQPCMVNGCPVDDDDDDDDDAGDTGKLNPNASLYSFSNPSCCDVLVDDSERIGLDADNDGNPHGDGVSRNVCMATMTV